jgi:outer membrane protein assembly factor BamB
VSPLSRRQLLAAGTGVLGAIAGCTGGPNRSLPASPSGEWRQRAHDVRNTGAADVTVPPRGTPAWDEGEAHIAAPLVSDGTVFSVAHEATALNARTGEYEWEADLQEKADYAPALLGDRLVVGAGDRLVALARGDGSELWSVSLPELVRSPVAGTTERPALAAVNVGDAGLQAFDPASGDRLWRDGTQSPRQPAIDDDAVYVAGYREDGDTGVLRALDAADGSRQWERALDHPDTAPVVAGDGLLVADDGRVAVHDPEDGERLRTLTGPGRQIDVPPAVADGTAFVAQGGGGLAAVSIEDGTVRWTVGVHVSADTGITVGREAVVAPVSDLPGVAAFERADGSTRWEYTIEGFDAVASTPATLADGAVFFASNESTGVLALGDLPAEE